MKHRLGSIAGHPLGAEGWAVTFPRLHQEESTQEFGFAAMGSWHERAEGVAIPTREQDGLSGVLENGSGKVLCCGKNWSREMNWMGEPYAAFEQKMLGVKSEDTTLYWYHTGCAIGEHSEADRVLASPALLIRHHLGYDLRGPDLPNGPVKSWFAIGKRGLDHGVQSLSEWKLGLQNMLWQQFYQGSDVSNLQNQWCNSRHAGHYRQEEHHRSLLSDLGRTNRTSCPSVGKYRWKEIGPGKRVRSEDRLVQLVSTGIGLERHGRPTKGNLPSSNPLLSRRWRQPWN
jgi:hypothetical protein